MINKQKIIMAAVIVTAVAILGLSAYSWISGIPLVSLFSVKNKMERTATQMYQIDNLHRWVFLTFEGEEVAFLPRRGILEENICKIYPGRYDLGIDLEGRHWYTIDNGVNGSKTAKLTLPQPCLLDGGIDELNVFNVYGESDDAEKSKMKSDADNRMRSRAMRQENIAQIKKNAESHFKRLFRNLGCDSVSIEWEKSPRQ
jgi:hypothetical protein